jgi:hypothetical protein
MYAYTHTHETTTVKGIRTVLSPFSVLDLILDLRRSWTRVRWLPRNHRVGMAGVYWVSMTGHDRIFWLKYHSWRTMGLMGFFYFLLGIFKANFSIDQTSLIRWQMHKLFWVHKWFCRSCLTNPPCKGWDTEFWARPIQDVPISSQFLSKCLSEDIRSFCSIDFPTWQPQFVTRFPNVVVSTGGLSTNRLPTKNRWLHHVSMHFPWIICRWPYFVVNAVHPVRSLRTWRWFAPPPSYSFPRLGPFFSMKHMGEICHSYCGWREIHRNHHQKDAWNSINHGINMDKTPFSTGDSDFATIHCMSDYGNSYVRYELL